MQQQAYVYFISPVGRDDVVKIGMTTREPEDRLADLQAGSADTLEVLSALKVSYTGQNRYDEHDNLVPYAKNVAHEIEQTLHEVYAPYRLHNEWFRRVEHMDIMLMERRLPFTPRTKATISLSFDVAEGHCPTCRCGGKHPLLRKKTA